jgi:hypothetical protein
VNGTEEIDLFYVIVLQSTPALDYETSSDWYGQFSVVLAIVNKRDNHRLLEILLKTFQLVRIRDRLHLRLGIHQWLLLAQLVHLPVILDFVRVVACQELGELVGPGVAELGPDPVAVCEKVALPGDFS